ncbi:hypothetical protein [uncultured Mediterranean phage uvDeep-CGR2-AD12-C183]|nr:hypothetical protein [uncultured Mediterranean phage uvDeep-CGR2-AD12-C183]
MAGKRKTSAKKKAVPIVKTIVSAEEKASRLEALRNAPIQMPKSVLTARADQESKLGTGVKCGRRTGYTPDRIEALLKNVRSGLPIMRACALAAIPQSNLYDWMKRYSDLSECIQQAESEYQAFALGTVNDGIANGDGHLAMKLLGARFGDEYATSKKVDVRSTHVRSMISPDRLAGLQSARVETDVVSAANALGMEEPDALPEKVTQTPPENDGSAENEVGGTPTTGGQESHTPPRLKQSHTGDSEL